MPADTRDQILDAAERLVQTRGYNGFSYADIAEELEIRKASLHHHYATKGELGLALIRRYEATFVAALGRIEESSQDARTRLEAYVGLYSGVLKRNRMCLCGMLAADFATLPKPMRAAVKHFFAANEQWLRKVLEAGLEAKRLSFSEPSPLLAKYIVSTLEGAMLMARSYGRTATFEAVAKRLIGEISSQQR